MADVIKTTYMGQPVHASNEYVFKDDNARNAIKPHPGDRARMQDGRHFFCWEKGIWENTESGEKEMLPDWNSTEGEQGFIQNRTHYADPDTFEELITLPPMSFDAEGESESYYLDELNNYSESVYNVYWKEENSQQQIFKNVGIIDNENNGIWLGNHGNIQQYPFSFFRNNNSNPGSRFLDHGEVKNNISQATIKIEKTVPISVQFYIGSDQHSASREAYDKDCIYSEQIKTIDLQWSIGGTTTLIENIPIKEHFDEQKTKISIIDKNSEQGKKVPFMLERTQFKNSSSSTVWKISSFELVSSNYFTLQVTLHSESKEHTLAFKNQKVVITDLYSNYLDIIEGQDYLITWNNVEYPVTCHAFSISFNGESMDFFLMGNYTKVLEDMSSADPGVFPSLPPGEDVPFVFVGSGYSPTYMGNINQVKGAPSENVKIKITKITHHIHELDSKYIKNAAVNYDNLTNKPIVSQEVQVNTSYPLQENAFEYRGEGSPLNFSLEKTQLYNIDLHEDNGNIKHYMNCYCFIMPGEGMPIVTNFSKEEVENFSSPDQIMEKADFLIMDGTMFYDRTYVRYAMVMIQLPQSYSKLTIEGHKVSHNYAPNYQDMVRGKVISTDTPINLIEQILCDEAAGESLSLPVTDHNNILVAMGANPAAGAETDDLPGRSIAADFLMNLHPLLKGGHEYTLSFESNTRKGILTVDGDAYSSIKYIGNRALWNIVDPTIDPWPDTGEDFLFMAKELLGVPLQVAIVLRKENFSDIYSSCEFSIQDNTGILCEPIASEFLPQNLTPLISTSSAMIRNPRPLTTGSTLGLIHEALSPFLLGTTIQIGEGSTGPFSIGVNSSSDSYANGSSIAIGNSSTASGHNSISIGEQSYAGKESIQLGNNNNALSCSVGSAPIVVKGQLCHAPEGKQFYYSTEYENTPNTMIKHAVSVLGRSGAFSLSPLSLSKDFRINNVYPFQDEDKRLRFSLQDGFIRTTDMYGRNPELKYQGCSFFIELRDEKDYCTFTALPDQAYNQVTYDIPTILTSQDTDVKIDNIQTERYGSFSSIVPQIQKINDISFTIKNQKIHIEIAVDKTECPNLESWFNHIPYNARFTGFYNRHILKDITLTDSLIKTFIQHPENSTAGDILFKHQMYNENIEKQQLISQDIMNLINPVTSSIEGLEVEYPMQTIDNKIMPLYILNQVPVYPGTIIRNNNDIVEREYQWTSLKNSYSRYGIYSSPSDAQKYWAIQVEIQVPDNNNTSVACILPGYTCTKFPNSNISFADKQLYYSEDYYGIRIYLSNTTYPTEKEIKAFVDTILVPNAYVQLKNSYSVPLNVVEATQFLTKSSISNDILSFNPTKTNILKYRGTYYSHTQLSQDFIQKLKEEIEQMQTTPISSQEYILPSAHKAPELISLDITYPWKGKQPNIQTPAIDIIDVDNPTHKNTFPASSLSEGNQLHISPNYWTIYDCREETKRLSSLKYDCPAQIKFLYNEQLKIHYITFNLTQAGYPALIKNCLDAWTLQGCSYTQIENTAMPALGTVQIKNNEDGEYILYVYPETDFDSLSSFLDDYHHYPLYLTYSSTRQKVTRTDSSYPLTLYKHSKIVLDQKPTYPIQLTYSYLSL